MNVQAQHLRLSCLARAGVVGGINTDIRKCWAEDRALSARCQMAYAMIAVHKGKAIRAACTRCCFRARSVTDFIYIACAARACVGVGKVADRNDRVEVRPWTTGHQRTYAMIAAHKGCAVSAAFTWCRYQAWRAADCIHIA